MTSAMARLSASLEYIDEDEDEDNANDYESLGLEGQGMRPMGVGERGPAWPVQPDLGIGSQLSRVVGCIYGYARVLLNVHVVDWVPEEDWWLARFPGGISWLYSTRLFATLTNPAIVASAAPRLLESALMAGVMIAIMLVAVYFEL